MTREQAIQRLQECERESIRDAEQPHSTADGVLCDLLTELGYADVVEAWDKVRKWYA